MANAFWNSAHSDNPIEHYSYRRGGKYINEYARTRPDNEHRYEGPTNNPNHLLGCYPTLFPYGKGGFEVERPIDVCYEKHIKWALTYHDKRQGCLPAFHMMLMTSGLRFRCHEQFPFLVFGVCQKRQVCRSVSLQIKKLAFQNHWAILERLRPEDFHQASKEEINRKPYSNAGIRLL